MFCKMQVSETHWVYIEESIAAKDSGFQLWRPCEQNSLLHKLLKAAWFTNETWIPAAGWPTGMPVPSMCNSVRCLILSWAFTPACSSCYFCAFHSSNKYQSFMALSSLLLGCGRERTSLVLVGSWGLRLIVQFLISGEGSQSEGFYSCWSAAWQSSVSLRYSSTFIIECSFVLGKRNHQSQFHATLK